MLENNKWYTNYLNYLTIPDNWNTVEEFCDWYMEQKMPIHIPQDSSIYITENVTSLILFRHKRFQVEMYLAKPIPFQNPEHYHPGIELCMVQIGAMHASGVLGLKSPVLYEGQSHNGSFNTTTGAVFLTFEKWDDGIQMNSAAVRWKGPTDGPIHDAMIKSYYPSAVVAPGYADVTLENTQ